MNSTINVIMIYDNQLQDGNDRMNNYEGYDKINNIT
jgi:hypothetical protein